MREAKFVIELTVTDPDTNLPVEIDVFKDENGGMFAIDASYLDQCFDDDEPLEIADPFFQHDGMNVMVNIRLTGLDMDDAVKNGVDAFIEHYGTKVTNEDNANYVELMMDDHYCINWKNDQYYIPENSMLFTVLDDKINDYLSENFKV